MIQRCATRNQQIIISPEPNLFLLYLFYYGCKLRADNPNMIVRQEHGLCRTGEWT